MSALAAEVEDALEYVAGEDYWDLRSLLAPDAVFANPIGEEVRVDEPVPAEFGFDESWDWDRDGTVTFGDYVFANHEWTGVIATGITAACEPDGTEIVCRGEDRVVFGAAAGLAAALRPPYWLRVTTGGASSTVSRRRHRWPSTQIEWETSAARFRSSD